MRDRQPDRDRWTERHKQCVDVCACVCVCVVVFGFVRKGSKGNALKILSSVVFMYAFNTSVVLWSLVDLRETDRQRETEAKR